MPITIAHAKSNTIADFTGTVTVFNSAGTTTTVLATDLVRPSDWNSAHAATFAVTGSEVAPLFNFGTGLTSTTAAGGITVGMDSGAYFEPFPLHNTNSTLSAPGIGTWYFDGPYKIPVGFGKGQFAMLVSNALGHFMQTTYSASSSGSLSIYQTINNQLALYRQGTGANTSQLSSVWTGDIQFRATWSIGLGTANTSSGTITNALSLSFPSQYDSAGLVTYATTEQSWSSAFGTSTVVSSYNSTGIATAAGYYSGARMDMVGFSSTIPPGEYWMAHMFTSTSSTAGTVGGIGTSYRQFSTQSRLGLLEMLVNAYRQVGKSVSNSTTNFQPFHGYLATTTSNATSIVDKNDIRGTTGRMYFNYFASTY